MWVCKICAKKASLPGRSCAACGRETDIPSNLAIAGEDAENLLKRLHACKARWLPNKPAWKSVREFQSLVRRFKTVSINVRPETLLNMLADERIRYTNLHDNLRAEAVVDYPRSLATKRKLVDLAVFGADGERLSFGALSVGGIGLYSYGAACMVLRNDAIKNAVSFLETNSFTFFNRDFPAVNINVPPGSRALWTNVSSLATVKHAPAIALMGRINRSAAEQLLIDCDGNKQRDKFIEAQLVPPLTIKHVAELIYAPALDRKAKAVSTVGKCSMQSKKLLADLLKRRGHDLGIKVRILP